MKPGFVYLKDIDSSIIQSVRYYSTENFLGKRVNGYEANTIICSHELAVKLKSINTNLKSQGYKIVVYDAYRPQMAVSHFASWASEAADILTKNDYYPTLDKSTLFDLGYISKRSAHSRGSTVDLTIMKITNDLSNITRSVRQLGNGEEIPFLDDNTLDMGASFDLFHDVSHHDTPLISKEHHNNRNILRNIMKAHGFKEYSKEWWHYVLDSEPFPQTYFDFVIC